MRLLRGSIVLLFVVALCAGALAEDGLVLHVKVPPEIDPDRMLVLFAQYGQGLTLGQARREKGEADFTLRIGEYTTAVKLLIYYPGCKLATAEIARADMGEPFTPVFEKLPTTPLTLKLTLSDGTPLAGRKVSLKQSIPDRAYFGSDWMVLFYNACDVASGTTDRSGCVTVQVPRLLDDPIFAGLKLSPGFDLRLDEDVLRAVAYDLVPTSIPAQTSYPTPTTVKLIYQARISGKVEESFLKRNSIDVPVGQSVQPGGHPVHSIWFQAQHKGGGQGVAVQADGSFAMPIPPGTYDLLIEVRRSPGTHLETFPVRKGFVLGEKERKEITVR
jgi:hypothetical protein